MFNFSSGLWHYICHATHMEEEDVPKAQKARNCCLLHEERMDQIDKIRVMARSSPFDELLMVQCLKQKGKVVPITSDATNDAPALKEVHIGLSKGIEGTEVEKDSFGSSHRGTY
ncbi:putative calcium-transporting ATPase [Vigna angularis]|uniref:Putative calcium-transporting ATPase n=1 Tax=Phaseolus angularis TaxID=3914 RepID=A0A8T0JLF6_PHAAN|nr:putative calcium-transporting ATPase [Vigna angularis]